MKIQKYIRLAALAMIAAFGMQATAADAVLRIVVSGYRLTEGGALQQLSELSGLSVTPLSGQVYSNALSQAANQNTFTATVPFGYKVGHWVGAYDDPFTRTTGEIVEGSEEANTVTIPWDANGQVLYLALVIEYDNTRTLTLAKSPFGEGTIGTNTGTYACMKGDVFTLNALPANDEGGKPLSKFRRWSDGVTHAQRTITVDTNAAYTAEFVPLSWLVSFDPQGGEVFPTAKRVTYGCAYGQLPTPVRTGYEFTGWRRTNGGGTVDGATPVEVSDNHALRATWDAKSYTIRGESAGEGSGTVVGAREYDFGSDAMLTAQAAAGSVFARWSDGETRNPRHVIVTEDTTYTAIFNVATYRVTFSYYDADGIRRTTEEQIVRHGEAATPPAEEICNRWGEHTFTGWANDSYKSVTADINVPAVYDAVKYEVMFAYRNVDGNCTTTMPQQVETGRSATPPSVSVYDSWRGHTFTGWNPDYGVIRSNCVITASYKVNTYRVTFVYRDAEGKEETHVEEVLYEGKVPFGAVDGLKSQWRDHAFLYWSMNDQPIEGDVIVTSDLRITARYESYARINFEANGGAGEMAPMVFTNYNGEVTLNANAFTRTGYTFDGWVTEDEKTKYADGAKVFIEAIEVITLKAVWTPITYTLTFEANGGIWASGANPSPISMTYDRPYALTVSTLTRNLDFSGYVLESWSRTADGAGERFPLVVEGANYTVTVSNLTTVADQPVTLYAIWKPESMPTYTITYNANGGTGTMAAQIVTIGETTALTSNAFTRVGYTFGGWTNATGRAFADGETLTSALVGEGETVALFAKWTPITYTVAFDANGGSGTMEPMTVAYDQSVALTANAFTKDGFEFIGWTNATGKAYADKATILNLTSEADAAVTLYAQWKETRNELQKALGTQLAVSESERGVWTILGEGQGIIRTSNAADGTLSVVIPAEGTFRFDFGVENSVGNELTVTFNGGELGSYSSSDDGKEIICSGLGTLVFSGTPDAGGSWTLKNFKWEAK